MKKILILFLVIIYNVLAVNATVIKFALISDLHLLKTQTDSIDCLSNSETSLKYAIDHINSRKDLDFVVFLGDNINKSNEILLEYFLCEIKKINKPYYIVIGNSDVHKIGGLTKEQYLKKLQKNSKYQKRGSFNYVFSPNRNVKCALLDGTMPYLESKHGEYTNETLKWLKNEINKNKNKTYYIFQHFPLVPPINKPEYSLYNNKAYFKILEDNKNIALIASGHYHLGKKTIDKNGIYHICVPSISNNDSIFYIVETKIFANNKKRKDENKKQIEVNIEEIKLN